MAEVIVDSSVVIDYLRGRAEAAGFLETRRKSATLSTHVVVVAEILLGARNQQEQEAIDRFFAEFHVYSIEGTDAQVALGLFRKYRLSHGVGWMDCLIAATVRRLDMPIATLDEKHFAIIEEVRIERPY